MRGKVSTQEDLFVCIRLEEMIPEDHLLKNIRKRIDFSFIDKHTENLYSNKGRPSIDPQVLLRMMLIGYLYGITSERRLCQEVHLNIAYRWFCGLSLEDNVPNHSSFSKNRNGRFYQTDIFRKLFHEIVKQAQEKGLIRGKYWSTDATLIAANAAMRSLDAIEVPFSEEEYLEALDQTHENLSGEKVKKLTSMRLIDHAQIQRRVWRQGGDRRKN
jgi:transposase